MKFSLKAYTTSAISFLVLHKEADSQVVYVNIDPDIVLNEGGQAAEIDLDQNGTIDFWFHNNSFTFYSESFSSYRLMQNILVGPEIEANFIAGETGEYGTGYGGVYTRYYPFALEAGVKIDSVMNLYNYDLQVMGLASFWSIGGTFDGFHANWFGIFVDETIDKFIGIKFLLENDSLCYGWIRCDVKDEGRTLIIKDYTYETTPEHPIIAGDTIHFVEVIDPVQLEPVFVYSFNENIYINLKDSAVAKVTIISLSGQYILDYKTSELVSTVDMTKFASGIYIVKVNYKNKVHSTKIAIH